MPQALSDYRPQLSLTATGGYNYQSSTLVFPLGGASVTSPFAQNFYSRYRLSREGEAFTRSPGSATCAEGGQAHGLIDEFARVHPDTRPRPFDGQSVDGDNCSIGV